MNANLQTIEPIRVTHEPPRVITPDASSVFARRARRLAQLAEGHALGEWLHFLSQLSVAQHEAMQNLAAARAAPKPIYALDAPPLNIETWPRDPLWRTEILPVLLDAAEGALPDVGREVTHGLRNASPEHLETLAEQLLLGDITPQESAALPLIGAALQVYWTRMAATLDAAALPRLQNAGACPCCGSQPSASVIRTGGEIAGLRYLHCGLCNTQWNMVRVKCSVCESTDGIAYHAIHQHAAHVKAESCDGCKSYLKIMQTEHEPDADALADDLATLTLDFLMDETGYMRSGINPLLITVATTK